MTTEAENNASSEGVSVGAIATAPPEKPPVDAKPINQNPLTGQPDPNLPHHLGWFGKFVGGGPEKAGNIAAMVIVLAIILIVAAVVALAFVDTVAAAEVMKLVIGSAFGLITGALGFIFGASTRGDS